MKENPPEIDLPDTLPGQAAEEEVAPDDAMQQFLEERKTVLGGTDMAAILGLSKYKTAWDVAAEKKGLIPPTVATERMQWGTLLEAPIAKEYARRTGQTLTRAALVRDREYPFLGGHPDRLVSGSRKGVEIKTVEGPREREFSPPGEPIRVPKEYYIQVQHYLSVTEYDAWDLVALMGLRRMTIYPMVPEPRVIRLMREKGREFWERYVLGPDLPPIEPSEAARRYIKATFPEPREKTFVLASDLGEEVIVNWQQAKQKREEWEKEEEKWKLRLQALIGYADGIRGQAGMVTWRKDKDTTCLHTDWESVCHWMQHEYNVSIPDKIVNDHTVRIVSRKGARKLLFRPSK